MERIAETIEEITAADVRAWLNERLANCRRVAQGKTGLDRDGWLEDAAYFAAAIGLVDWSAAERADRH